MLFRSLASVVFHALPLFLSCLLPSSFRMVADSLICCVNVVVIVVVSSSLLSSLLVALAAAAAAAAAAYDSSLTDGSLPRPWVWPPPQPARLNPTSRPRRRSRPPRRRPAPGRARRAAASASPPPAQRVKLSRRALNPSPTRPNVSNGCCEFVCASRCCCFCCCCRWLRPPLTAFAGAVTNPSKCPIS